MGKFIHNDKGNVTIHLCTPDILTKEDIKALEADYGEELRCYKCGTRLQAGDQKDHLWPHFKEHNRCKSCLGKERQANPNAQEVIDKLASEFFSEDKLNKYLSERINKNT